MLTVCLGTFGFVSAGSASAQSYFDWKQDASDANKIVVWMSPDVLQQFQRAGYYSGIGAAPGPNKAIVDGKVWQFDVSYGTGENANRRLHVVRLKRPDSLPDLTGTWKSAHNFGHSITLRKTATGYAGTIDGYSIEITIAESRFNAKWSGPATGETTSTNHSDKRVEWGNGNVFTR